MDDASSEYGSADELKRENVRNLVEQIRMGRKKVNRTKNLTNRTMKRANISEAGVSSGRGRHTNYKLYIWWQHFSNGKYRVVTVRKGGGTRMMEYKADEDLSVETIIEKGVHISFLRGKVHSVN